MLRGDDHRVDAFGLAIGILDADLALAVGPQEVELTPATHLAQLAAQLVGHHDGQRHQLRRFIAGIAEHETLVAGAAGIHAHCDVGRLALDGVQDSAGVAIEAVQRIVIPDMVDDASRQLGHIDVSSGRDFARYHANAGCQQDLASHAAHRIVAQDGIQYGVRYLIRHLVGMTFSHGLRRENMSHSICHCYETLLDPAAIAEEVRLCWEIRSV